MNEDTWPTEKSPCTGVCRCNAQNICIGCGRTRDEIASWIQMNNDQRKECKCKCVERLAQLSSNDEH